MRNASGDSEADSKSSIPITVRQLEALVRISESLAKMELLPFVQDRHVVEAIRLFGASTLRAAMSGDLAGAEGFTSDADRQTLVRIEKQIKKRFQIGSSYRENTIIDDLAKQNFQEGQIKRVLQCMKMRGEIEYRSQSRMYYRVK